jgi:hypothetical protein
MVLERMVQCVEKESTGAELAVALVLGGKRTKRREDGPHDTGLSSDPV